MGLITNIWKRLTPTVDLEQSSGKLETLFFESVYRVAYIVGMSTNDNKVWQYKLYSSTVKVLIGLFVFGELCFIFIDALTMEELVGNTNVVILQFISIYRYKNMLDNKKLYKKIAVAMESPNFDLTTEKRQRLVSFWANRNEKFLKVLLGLGNLTLAAWYIFPLVDDLEYNHIIGISLPFECNTPLRYGLTYIILAIVFHYVSHSIMTTELIIQAHLIHLLCQYTVLSDCFENILIDCQRGHEDVEHNYLIYNKSFTDKYVKRLANLVEQHKAILEHTMNLRKSLSRPMLGQLAASGILICFIGYQATTTLTVSFVKSLMSTFFLGYNLFEFYITCRWCEEITIESQKVGEAAYSSGWESGTATLPGVRSTLILVIARANKPLVLTAGGMYNLSLSSYATLVKTSYSALTVLLRFRHE